jgi:hypothetical protein
MVVPSAHLIAERSSFSKIVGHCVALAEPPVEMTATNEQLVRQFEDAQEDNAERCRGEVRAAQCSYRNATADIFGED